MSKKEPYFPDPTQDALEHLDNTLKKPDPESSALVPKEERDATPEDPEVGTRNVDFDTDTEDTESETEAVPEQLYDPRILIFTKDTSIADETSESFKRVSGLKEVFPEVHVVILDYKKGTEELQVSRPFKNLWFYRTQSTSWWKQGYDAYRLAQQQMVFSGGFRADVVIAEDPYDAGLAGWFIAKKYEAPFQLHLYDDFYDEAYLESTEHPGFYTWSSDYLLQRVKSVRTKTEFQRQAVIEINKKLKDNVETLPNYYNLEVWKDAVPAFDLKERYPQFKFIMLHISLMTNSSHSSEVLKGAAQILRLYPTIGLVILGAGPQRSHLEKLAIELGVQNQVQFEPMPNEVLSHMKSADILLHLSENSEEDVTILAAASVKLPMVALSTGLAGDLFVDDESAQLCDAADQACVAEAANRYLNKNTERSSFAMNAFDIVFKKIVQDYDGYIEAYKNSIEQCLK